MKTEVAHDCNATVGSRYGMVTLVMKFSVQAAQSINDWQLCLRAHVLELSYCISDRLHSPLASQHL